METLQINYDAIPEWRRDASIRDTIKAFKRFRSDPKNRADLEERIKKKKAAVAAERSSNE